MINVTPVAEKHILEQLAARKSGVGIRIGVETGGCTGFQYVLAFADAILPEDAVHESGNVTIIISVAHMPYLEGLTLDFETKGLQSGFVFQNPNEQGRCGCGESFNV